MDYGERCHGFQFGNWEARLLLPTSFSAKLTMTEIRGRAVGKFDRDRFDATALPVSTDLRLKDRTEILVILGFASGVRDAWAFSWTLSVLDPLGKSVLTEKFRLFCDNNPGSGSSTIVRWSCRFEMTDAVEPRFFEGDA
jgi:hypothetical protein